MRSAGPPDTQHPPGEPQPGRMEPQRSQPGSTSPAQAPARAQPGSQRSSEHSLKLLILLQQKTGSQPCSRLQQLSAKLSQDSTLDSIYIKSQSSTLDA